MLFFGAIWDKLALNLVLIKNKFFEIYAERAPLNGANWDKFSEQHYHQSIKSIARIALFNANKMQI